MKNKLRFIWNHFEEIILVPAFAFSTILIFIQIILRAFDNSLSWSEELVRYLYVWETWLGVSYATKRGSQLRITMLTDKLQGKAKVALQALVTVIWLGFALFILYQGVRATSLIAMYGQKSSALRIPMQYCYFAVPMGMILMSVRLVEGVILKIKNRGKEGSAV